MSTEDALVRRRAKNEAVTTLRGTVMFLRSPAVALPSWADDAQARAVQPAGDPVVLVLGEPDRGKSSLVQLLAPHDAGPDAPEAVYRAVVPPAAAGRVWDEAAAAGTTVGAAGVVVPWRECTLGADVTIVDTPCIGGIEGAHARVSRALAMAATAAVFVTDAGAPLSRPELDYLEHLLAPVHALVVVVTKTDLYPGSWREVVDSNRALLAERSGRDAPPPVIGLSTRLAERARLADDPVRAATLERASGWRELSATLAAASARAEVAPVAGALLIARTGLVEHRTALQTRQRLADAVVADDVESVIAEHTARLEELDRIGGRWELYLNRDYARLRAEVLGIVRDRLEEWRTGWRHRLETTRRVSPDDATRLGGELLWELAALRAELLELVAGRLDGLVRTLFDGVDVPTTVASSITGSAPSTTHVLRRAVAPSWATSAMGQAQMGFGMVRTVGSIVDVLAPGLGSLFGLWGQLAGAAGYVLANRGDQGSQLNQRILLEELNRVSAAEQSSIGQALEDLWNEARPEVVIGFRDHLRDSTRAATELLAEARRARGQRKAAAEADVAEIARAHGAVTERVASVDTALGSLVVELPGTSGDSTHSHA